MFGASERVRRILASGRPVFGPFCQLPCAGLIEIFAVAGYDLVVIDLEHGAINLETAENMIRAGDVHGMTTMVRVMANTPELIAQALNLGPSGVIVPQVNSLVDAKAASDAARFAPRGSRGVCPFVRSSSYSKTKDEGYYEEANKDVILGIILEGKEVIEQIDELLELPGLDLIMLAPYDLSQSLGVTGQIQHPLVTQTIETACRKADGAGKDIGFFIDKPELAAKYAKLGVKWIFTSVDTHIFYEGAKRWRSEHTTANEPTAPPPCLD